MPSLYQNVLAGKGNINEFVKPALQFSVTEIPKSRISEVPTTERHPALEPPGLGIRLSTTTPLYPHLFSPDTLSLTKAPNYIPTPGTPPHHNPLRLTHQETQYMAHHTTPASIKPLASYNNDRVRPHSTVGNIVPYVSDKRDTVKWERINTSPGYTYEFQETPSTSSWAERQQDHSISSNPLLTSFSTTQFSVPGYKPPETSQSLTLPGKQYSPSYHINTNYKQTHYLNPNNEPVQNSAPPRHGFAERHSTTQAPPSAMDKGSDLIQFSELQTAYLTSPESNQYHRKSQPFTTTTTTTSMPFSQHHNMHDNLKHYSNQVSESPSHIQSSPFHQSHYTDEDISNYDDDNDDNNDDRVDDYFTNFNPSDLLDKETFTTLLELAKREWQHLQSPHSHHLDHLDHHHHHQSVTPTDDQLPVSSGGILSNLPGNPDSYPTVARLPPDMSMTDTQRYSGVPPYEENSRPQQQYLFTSQVPRHSDMHPEFDVLLKEMLEGVNTIPADEKVTLPQYLDRYISNRKLESKDEKIEGFKQNLELLLRLITQKSSKEEVSDTLSDKQRVSSNRFNHRSDNEALQRNQTHNNDNEHETKDVGDFGTLSDIQFKPQHKAPQVRNSGNKVQNNYSYMNRHHNEKQHTGTATHGPKYHTAQSINRRRQTTPVGGLVTWTSVSEGAWRDHSEAARRTATLNNRNKANLFHQGGTFGPSRSSLISSNGYHNKISNYSVSNGRTPDQERQPSWSVSGSIISEKPEGKLTYSSSSHRRTQQQPFTRFSSLNSRPKQLRVLDGQGDHSSGNEASNSNFSYRRNGRHGHIQILTKSKDPTFYPFQDMKKKSSNLVTKTSNDLQTVNSKIETHANKPALSYASGYAKTSANFHNLSEISPMKHYVPEKTELNNGNDRQSSTTDSTIIHPTRPPATFVTFTQVPTPSHFTLPIFLPKREKIIDEPQLYGTTVSTPIPVTSTSISETSENKLSSFTNSGSFPAVHSYTASSVQKFPLQKYQGPSRNVSPASIPAPKIITFSTSNLASPQSSLTSSPTVASTNLMSKFLCRNAEHHDACVVCMEEVGHRPECVLRRP
ncbi:hypothetical protein Pmani_019222 [Petrolisthes manimaculis]|nr:hypothetical protein Pmani_019222 [Petrolisthes manimaculis]